MDLFNYLPEKLQKKFSSSKNRGRVFTEKEFIRFMQPNKISDLLIGFNNLRFNYEEDKIILPISWYNGVFEITY